MIRGYAEQPSPVAGHQLTLRVATSAPRFRVEFYRYGDGAVCTGRTGWQPGRLAPSHLPGQDWGQANTGLRGEPLAPWPAYRFRLPAEWTSGVYLAALIEDDSPAPRAGRGDGGVGEALFVVRSAAPGSGRILYKVPLLTYQAYNLGVDPAFDPATGLGSWCLYTVPAAADLPGPVPAAVNLHRPGGGAGGTPWDTSNFDPFDPTPRQTFGHWDAPFIRWAERAGYRLDYCTDVDLHRLGPRLLAPYRLLLSVGHDEYWSQQMRAAVAQHVRSAGNVAFFSGNTCWWRVEFDTPERFRRVGTWSDSGEPENALTGVSFRNGGERDRDDHPRPVGYQVQHADHWVYAGTRLRDGEVFGDGAEEYLVGYECDGAVFDRAPLAAGRAVAPTGRDGTPGGFVILGVGDTAPSGWGQGNRAATMGLYTAGGTVFTAATTDWPRVLAAGCSPVGQITRTVLDRLSAG